MQPFSLPYLWQPWRKKGSTHHVDYYDFGRRHCDPAFRLLASTARRAVESIETHSDRRNSEWELNSIKRFLAHCSCSSTSKAVRTPRPRESRTGYILSLTVSTGIAAVGLLLYVWNRQIEKRGDSFRSLVEYGTELILAFGADGPVVYHRRNTLILPVKSPPTCPPDSQATNLAYVRSSPIWPAT